MKQANSNTPGIKEAGIVLAFLLLAVLAFAVTAPLRQEQAAPPESPAASTLASGGHSLGEASGAKFLSIFEYDANDGVSSFMVGGRTELFASFAAAIQGALPLADAAGADESFSDLLVLVFGGNDTLELPYSRSRGLLIFEERPYRPAADLAPLIDAVQEKLK